MLKTYARQNIYICNIYIKNKAKEKQMVDSNLNVSNMFD